MKDTVASVFGIAFRINLSRQHSLGPLPNRQMDVRRSWAVVDRFDRAKIVFPLAVGHESAEALEISIDFIPVRSFGVNVDPRVVGLPDFNNCVSDRLPRWVENATC